MRVGEELARPLGRGVRRDGVWDVVRLRERDLGVAAVDAGGGSEDEVWRVAGRLLERISVPRTFTSSYSSGS
jgi:hypothetical protein